MKMNLHTGINNIIFNNLSMTSTRYKFLEVIMSCIRVKLQFMNSIIIMEGIYRVNFIVKQEKFKITI